MKSPYVADLEPNQVITSVFLVLSKDIRQKKSGEPYLSMMLGDRTGDVEAKMWDNASEVMHTFDRDDFVRVKGLYQIFQNRPQITVHKMIRIDDGEVEFADFFPASKRNPDEMWAELQAHIRDVGNPHLRKLLEVIFEDPRIAAAYKIAPAAKVVHHAYLSGLLEHVLSICQLAKLTAPHYPGTDLDLLLAGAMLHDIGKIDELTYHRGFGYSSDGQLLGHITMGVRLVEDKLRQVPDFPEKLRNLLEHMILSHHGELEFGSPKAPMFPEALLLHHLDNLDSKMDCMRAAVEKDRQIESCWTTYNSALDRVVLKKLRYLEEEPAPRPVRSAPPQPERTQAAPAQRPPAPSPAPRPAAPASVFGDKLRQALQADPDKTL
ncbi:MAG TPA: HD domain-containing protein [Bryobacteraceae bacterium]|jgi:3'-5' exoribonuclease|nr:HD domain-containing protein [Bryobacteraceae bacterium]